MCEKEEELPNRGALREVPLMGVIYVVHEASKLGFYNGNPEVRGRNHCYANFSLSGLILDKDNPRSLYNLLLIELIKMSFFRLEK